MRRPRPRPRIEGRGPVLNFSTISAASSTLLSSLLLLLVFALAERHAFPSFSRSWIVGWSLYTLRLCFDIAAAAFPASGPLQDAILALLGASSAYLLHAAYRLLEDGGGAERRDAAFPAAPLALALGALGPLLRRLGAPPSSVTLLFFFVVAAIQVFTGAAFLRLALRERSAGAALVSAAFALWGLHKLDYPLLRSHPLLGPLGYQLSAFLQIAVGVGVSLFMYELSRRRADREARRYRELFEGLSDPAYLVDFSDGRPGRIVEHNAAARELLGWSREELEAMTVEELEAGAEQDGEPEAAARALLGASRPSLRRLHRAKDGSFRPFEINVRPIEVEGRPMLLGIARDLSRREADEAALREALERSRLLLREIHHRVKNNLQIVSSLLALEALRMRDPRDKEALDHTRSRVSAMALVHEMLYKDERIESVELDRYLAELVRGADSLRGASGPVALELDLRPLRSGIDRAIPAGLLLIELVSNAYKHAFGPEGGTLRVALLPEGEGHRLTVEDDGLGLDSRREAAAGAMKEEAEPPRRGLGLEIASSLAAQLGSALEPGPGAGGRGTRFSVYLPPESSESA